MSVNPNQVFKTIEELSQSDLDLEDKIKKLPVLIISNDSNTRDSIAILFQKRGFNRIISAKNTLETIRQLKEKKGTTELLRLSISDIDIGDKYFHKEDFYNIEGFDAEVFWKNCIEEKIMTIIGDIGIPVSYDNFIKKIETFGTVDDNLIHNMKKITDKVKTLDSKMLLSLLEERNLISGVKSFYIIKDSNDPHIKKLNNEMINDKKYNILESPINAESVYDKLTTELKNLINIFKDPINIKSIEIELPLTEAQKEELMTTFQQVNFIIDKRVEKISEKYSEKIDQGLINEAKRKIYKAMAHYAIKNELQYFHFFVRGMKGVFSHIENEMKYSDIRQVFLFNNILNDLNNMHYEIIDDDVKQCGIIILMIINNFSEMEKNGIKTAANFDPMLFYRALGIIFLWPSYTVQFVQILSQNPNYYQYFLNKENRMKQMDAQNYQNLQRRFISFTEKVVQVEKCTNTYS